MNFSAFVIFFFFLFVNYPSDPDWNLAEQYSPIHPPLSWTLGPFLSYDNFCCLNKINSLMNLISNFDYFSFLIKLVIIYTSTQINF